MCYVNDSTMERHVLLDGEWFLDGYERTDTFLYVTFSIFSICNTGGSGSFGSTKFNLIVTSCMVILQGCYYFIETLFTLTFGQKVCMCTFILPVELNVVRMFYLEVFPSLLFSVGASTVYSIPAPLVFMIAGRTRWPWMLSKKTKGGEVEYEVSRLEKDAPR